VATVEADFCGGNSWGSLFTGIVDAACLVETYG